MDRGGRVMMREGEESYPRLESPGPGDEPELTGNRDSSRELGVQRGTESYRELQRVTEVQSNWQ